MRNILLILIAALLYGCPVLDPPKEHYSIHNNTDSAIYVYKAPADSIQLIPKLILFDRWMSNSVNLYGQKQDPIDPPDYKINAHSSSDFLVKWDLEKSSNNKKDKTIRLFFISENTMRTKQWNEICRKQLYTKKVILTEELFRKLNWEYNYNPPEFDTIQLIRSQSREYLEINSTLVSFTKVERLVSDQSVEGGDIIAYYSQKELKKVITTFYGETGKVMREYYFNKDGVFYVFIIEYFYNKPIYLKGSKIVSTKENRYYLFKNQLLKWIDSNNKSININAKEYQVEKKNLFEDIDWVLKSIKE